MKEITLKTRKEIAQRLGISTKTLRIYIKKLEKEICINPRKRLSPKETELIYEKLGVA
jgi:DNA-binding NarL/FixJ family response regulator